MDDEAVALGVFGVGAILSFLLYIGFWGAVIWAIIELVTYLT